LEVRVLRLRAASPEEVDFPCVEQVALLRRHLRQHQPETVALLTSLPPPQLNAKQWLADNRAAWGIEYGLHLRLDVSHLDACACPNLCASWACYAGSATVCSCTGVANKKSLNTKPQLISSPP
jgi:hypothetical protein